MTRTIQIEKRKRGFFGKIFLGLFWVFNALMLWAVIAGAGASVDTAQSYASDAERAGATIGTALGMGFLLFVWVAGAVILGLFALLTRGNKVVIERVSG